MRWYMYVPTGRNYMQTLNFSDAHTVHSLVAVRRVWIIVATSLGRRPAYTTGAGTLAKDFDMDRYDLIRELAVVCAKRMIDEGIDSVEFPAMMATVMKVFHTSWCKASGIPLAVGASMLEGIFMDIIENERKSTDINLN